MREMLKVPCLAGENVKRMPKLLSSFHKSQRDWCDMPVMQMEKGSVAFLKKVRKTLSGSLAFTEAATS